MKEYVISYVANMAQSTSARISISYYSPTRTPLPVRFEKAYMRLGTTVVSISRLPKEAPQVIVRNILIAFLIFRRFNDFRLFGRFPHIADFSLSRFSKLWNKRFQKLPMQTLLQEVSLLVPDINKSFPGWHWRMVYSPNVTDMVRQIATSVYSSILQLQDFQRSTEKVV